MASFLLLIRSRSVRPHAGGFTLVEMVVVIAIIGIISGVVITGQSAYNQSLLLTDTTYTVAFSVRQAQSLGLSSRNFGAAGSAQNVGYGVSFTSGATDRYTVFADTNNTLLPIPGNCIVGTYPYPEWKPGNCRYNSGDGIVKTYTFARGYILGFCGKNSGAASVCSWTGGLTNLDIVFMRPNMNVVITGTGGGTNQSFSCAELYVAPPNSVIFRRIRVSSLGEISTGQACP